MGFLADYVMDNGLAQITAEADELHICSQEPTNYTEAKTTFTRGNKSGPTIGAPEDRTPSGRRVVISAIVDGDVTSSGGATHWALVDTVNSRLLAVQALKTTQIVTFGNTFTLDAIEIGIPDAAA